jgi:hypothetical protein
VTLTNRVRTNSLTKWLITVRPTRTDPEPIGPGKEVMRMSAVTALVLATVLLMLVIQHKIT